MVDIRYLGYLKINNDGIYVVIIDGKMLFFSDFV